MIMFTNIDYEDRIGAMENYMNDIKGSSNLGDLIKLDNKVLAGFLYSKIKNAEELNIQFHILIKDYGFKLNLKDYRNNRDNRKFNKSNAFETGIEHNVVILKLKEKDMNVIEVKK